LRDKSSRELLQNLQQLMLCSHQRRDQRV